MQQMCVLFLIAKLEVLMDFIPKTLVAVRTLTPIHMGFVITTLVLVIVLTSIIVFS